MGINITANTEQVKNILDVDQDIKFLENAKKDDIEQTSKKIDTIIQQAIENEKKREIIQIKTTKELPKGEKGYLRKENKSYKIIVQANIYEFFGNGKCKITKNDEEEKADTQDIITDVEKAIEKEKNEEEAKKAQEEIQKDQQKRQEKEKKEEEEKVRKQKEKEKKEEEEKAKKTEKSKEKNMIEGPMSTNQSQEEKYETEIKPFQSEISKLRGATDAKGNIILEADFQSIEAGPNGRYIKIQKDGKWGLTNTKGEIIIQPIYEEIGFPIEGNIACKLQGKYGIINEKNEIIIPRLFQNIA